MSEANDSQRAPWRTTGDGIIVVCRLTPKGGRDAIEGVATLSDGARVVVARVRAAPEDGRANKALCELLAEWFGVAASHVSMVSGGKSRIKQVAISGDPAALMARLNVLGD
jgi:uncharacterized protein